jgi:penicillin amidase
MAQRLGHNAGNELLYSRLKAVLDGNLFNLITRGGAQSSASDAGHGDMGQGNAGESNAASNNWVVAGSRTASGKPILANDPHLALAAPSTWYLARIVTPERTLIGATAPGLPQLVLGTNGHVAWGFTTTLGDVEDIYDEKLSGSDPTRYETPTGTAPFETRTETIKVRGQPDAHLIVRSTRHGPVINDAGVAPPPPGNVMRLVPHVPGHVLSMSWVGTLPDDHTPEALLRMSRAGNASEFRAALRDFAAPQQNVVYADVAGTIGFVAAGRVPVRRNLYDHSQLPVPGWTDDTDWTGMVPFDSLPQQLNPASGWIATANNDVSAYGKGFLGADFDPGFRYRRISEVLSQAKSMTLDDTLALQQDILSTDLRDAIREWLPQLDAHADIAAGLQAWDGLMRRDQAAPLIAITWVDHVSRRLLAERMGETYDNWWFWQTDALRRIVADGRWCRADGTPGGSACRQVLTDALDDALADLTERYGTDWRKWKWGDAHRVAFEHPIWSNVPIVDRLVDADLPADGDNATVNNGTPLPPERPSKKRLAATGSKLPAAAVFPDVHGPSMRFAIDMADPLNPVFALAGGQSGNPLSPHYDDLLRPWRDGQVRPILLPITHHLTLQPTTSVKQ